MEVKLTLALPHDQLSVPLARGILKRSLQTLGIDEETISDIELALTEACTNVLDHASGEDDYTVSAGINGQTCIIEVVDRGGGGFDGSEQGHLDAEPHAEDGRGIQLMRALVDRLEFENRPAVGTVVHLEKRLTWDTDAPIAKLDGSAPASR
jgi:serine/threonine-protein kinase RsbW